MYWQAVVLAPTRSRPWPQTEWVSRLLRAAVISSRIRATCCSSCSPAGVRVTLRAARSNSRQPTSSSKAFIA